jgi:TPR repeat protein
MRTSEAIVALALVGLLGGIAATGGLRAAEPQVAAPAVSPAVPAAVDAGIAHFRRGDYAKAVPLLDIGARQNVFAAQYTLAQIYADDAGSETDHAKAFMLYQAIADEYRDVDPEDSRRAPFVARALTALAGYLQVGLPQIGVSADPDKAAEHLHHAALFFGYEEAQFELVKIKLKGDGVAVDVASARHWLSVLTQRGHAGAQAFLADLYWRGRHVEHDPIRALALIAVAVENAPARDRIWIEDVYQNLFCSAAEGTRKKATAIVAEWRTRYGRKPDPRAATLHLSAIRTCQNGERVAPLQTAVVEPPAGAAASAPTTTGALPAGLPAPLPVPGPVQPALPPQSNAVRDVGVSVGAVAGNAAGNGIIAVGATPVSR